MMTAAAESRVCAKLLVAVLGWALMAQAEPLLLAAVMGYPCSWFLQVESYP